MKAVRFACPTIVMLALTMSEGLAHAQAPSPDVPDAKSSPAVEVTPFVAIDSRGTMPIGTAVSFPLSPRFSVETEVGYRRAEGNINALSTSANLLSMLPRVGRARPYLASGAGIAQYGAPIVTREGFLVGTQPMVAFEVNAGGGVKIPVDDSWGLRTDARWFKSFGRQGSEHWRVANGISLDVRKR